MRTYHVNDTNPSAMSVTVKNYQVWSSVLGSSLTTISPTGTKQETKVFAGNAVIAKQIGNGVEWTTADPVTGTLAKYGAISQEGVGYAENYEPLGQRINNNDPEEPPDPTYETRLGSADDPQWQCQVQRYFGGFQAMPWSCQFATKDEQSVPDRKAESVILLNLKIDKTAPAIFDKSSKAGYAVNSMRNAALTSSSKRDVIIEGGVKGEVDIQITYLEEIFDSYSAEFSQRQRIIEENGYKVKVIEYPYLAKLEESFRDKLKNAKCKDALDALAKKLAIRKGLKIFSMRF